MAYYCLHKLKMLPSEYLALDRYEKAFVIAAVQEKIKNDKNEAARIKAKN